MCPAFGRAVDESEGIAQVDLPALEHPAITTAFLEPQLDLHRARFGSSLNFNVHLHMLVLDGVYANENGKVRFQPLPASAAAMLTHLLDVIVSRVLRCLERDGLLVRDREQPWLDLEVRDALTALGAASIQYRIAVGPQAGRKVLTLKLAAPAHVECAQPFTVARDEPRTDSR